ncbi:MAG: ATP phosphoribosyltransferase [Candidatus Uhrbacteria bacterium GW2011_GWE2_40_58]|nr:MAG: ATP phosphoribosyltransferase [Candidatus Uhrbacteria bacterium GW2011_GWF2_40_263]KKR68229.1 MAG: ATP phosphoribosyltransferase [Candidatus Uhrbacteria bacterium GW2011_GWE2_40_58]OGL94155.1 MAG: ATP phosphoribosyltransferase [Candidatus Uhrbacteria bacterium RIFOXYA2_FULL_40_9]OGL97489.1 MAG: ATP phosphoribosyltransferase [Candidatus Uhrbacteria bacterium RIFOXYB2_FULL_41_18]HBK35123.1 ATP phosphoribosyltransferase [Candidatus Uhrbacteria bacterium]
MNLVLPKGRLFEGVVVLLRQSGIKITRPSDRCYHPSCSDPMIDVWIRKPRAIPQLLSLGLFDVGFCGLDLIKEAGDAQLVPLLNLGLNPVVIVVAVHTSQRDLLSTPPKRPILIATEYERLADEWAMKQNLAHITIQTFGSTEGYPPVHADLVMDCVETGETMEANGLIILETLFESSTWLVANKKALKDPVVSPRIQHLQHTLQGVYR